MDDNGTFKIYLYIYISQYWSDFPYGHVSLPQGNDIFIDFSMGKTHRFELQVGWKHGALIQRLESQRKAAGGRGPRLESWNTWKYGDKP